MTALRAGQKRGWFSGTGRSGWVWLGLIVGGYLARVALLVLSEGCNDIRTWRWFGKLVSLGLGDAYVKDGMLNHPPLTALWSAFVSHHVKGCPWTFAQLFKVPPLLADLGTGFLLFSSWRARGLTTLGLRAFAGYALAVSPMLISSYHGNTDSIYFFFVILACYLMEAKHAPFWAGIALSAALNVKVIPILFALPLASRCRDLKSFAKYALGGVLGMLPYAIAYATFTVDQRDAFIRNIFGYSSLPDNWGIELVVRSLVAITKRPFPGLAVEIREAGGWYLGAGGKVLVSASVLFALWHLGPGRRRFNAYELCALTFLGFMIFASGFGVQYMGCMVAPMFACWVSGGIIAGASTGLMIGSIYLMFLEAWHPLYSYHDRLVPDELSGLTMATWLTLIALVFKVIQRRSSARAHLAPPRGLFAHLSTVRFKSRAAREQPMPSIPTT